jgi:hypothetical protein
MAPFFAFAVATYGQIGVVRQGCEEVEEARSLWPSHLAAVASDKGLPGRGVSRLLRHLD